MKVIFRLMILASTAMGMEPGATDDAFADEGGSIVMLLFPLIALAIVLILVGVGIVLAVIVIASTAILAAKWVQHQRVTEPVAQALDPVIPIFGEKHHLPA